jgi:hypothetical protein
MLQCCNLVSQTSRGMQTTDAFIMIQLLTSKPFNMI